MHTLRSSGSAHTGEGGKMVLTIDLCNCSFPDDGPVSLETCSSLS